MPSFRLSAPPFPFRFLVPSFRSSCTLVLVFGTVVPFFVLVLVVEVQGHPPKPPFYNQSAPKEGRVVWDLEGGFWGVGMGGCDL